MSLPKEPRQKMINMMYLVLTALLALNVSVEVLNAFKTVNRSIERSNGVVDQKNGITYAAFTRELIDPQTAALAKIWAPPAMQVKSMSATISAYIESLKERLIQESNPKINKEGKREFTDGNLDAATRLMDKDGQGRILYDSLKKFRLDLLKVLDPANYPDLSDKIKQDLKAQQEEFAKRLPIDTRIPESEAGNHLEGSDSAKNWTIRYFHMSPTVAALTILSKFQSDVKNSESQVVDYLHKQIGEVKVVFDKFEPLVSPSATYLMPGDNLDIQAGIGAFSAAAKPKVYFNGQFVDLGPDGTADWKTKVGNTSSVDVKIEYTKPDGSTGTIDKIVKYTVGQPSGASVFLEKMNVLYIAEENPIKISGGSVGREKVKVSFDQGEISHGDGDEWVAVPKTPGMGHITVNADGKITTFEMRIKYLPNPTGFVGSKQGGAMSSAEFKAIGGLLARLDNSDFISPFKVVGYKIAALGGGISSYVEATVDGPRWGNSPQAAAIVAKATPSTNIFFDNIRVQGKDGRIRELPPMVFSLK
jgi:gliding motility-associated protein GldM